MSNETSPLWNELHEENNGDRDKMFSALEARYNALKELTVEKRFVTFAERYAFMKATLDKIANVDHRGHRSNESIMAFMALHAIYGEQKEGGAK